MVQSLECYTLKERGVEWLIGKLRYVCMYVIENWIVLASIQSSSILLDCMHMPVIVPILHDQMFSYVEIMKFLG